MRRRQDRVSEAETNVSRLGLTLALLSLILMRPTLVGLPAIVGVLMSLGLVLYAQLHRRQRKK